MDWIASVWQYLAQLMPQLNQGLWVSIELIVPSALIGLAIGVVCGVLRVYGNKYITKVMNFYVAVFRGTPLVVQLFVWYYGLPHLGIFFSPVGASIFGFAMCSGAYHSEYIRGGLLSIRQGQLKAAQALGFTPWQAVTNIILPQAFRRALPGCGNEFVYLIKYSSLAYIVTCIELTGTGHNIASKTFQYTRVFMVVGAYYLFLVTIASWLLSRVECWLSIPGFECKRED
ncbi:MAG: amino acid ABC transporter permease [Desulfovibrio sp.]|uniref:amino acid ABC transporter permease n=1 Tax=Desulfovibrio sp. 7SRBS1 TaxID=3378064 RepID=UPI003B3C4BB6